MKLRIYAQSSSPCLYPIKKTTLKVVLQFRLNTRQQLTLCPVKAYAGEGIYSLTLALKGRLLFVPALPALKLRPNPRVQAPCLYPIKKTTLKVVFFIGAGEGI